MNIFTYLLLQGIAKGRITVDLNQRFHPIHHVMDYSISVISEGRIVAQASRLKWRPEHIAICGKVVRTKYLYKLKGAMELVEQRKADRIALNKLMSYLSGSSEDSLTNK